MMTEAERDEIKALIRETLLECVPALAQNLIDAPVSVAGKYIDPWAELARSQGAYPYGPHLLLHGGLRTQ